MQKHALQSGLRVLGLGVVVIAILGGLLYLAERQEGSGQPAPTANIVTDTDHATGNPGAPVTIIEYADFQCPACASYAPVMERIISDYSPDDVRVVYRYFPLKTIHPNATLAAQAAEAASLQGKFWEMHTLLYERQAEWEKLGNPRDMFATYATTLSLDADKFTDDMDSKEVRARVNADYISGTKAGINSTPTFFVNGEEIDGPRGYDAFKEVIDAKLE